MKILIFECWGQPVQLGTGLEIAETEAEKGNKVQYVNIGEHLPYREWDLPLDGSRSKTVYSNISLKKTLSNVKKVMHENVTFSRDTLLSKKEIRQLKENMIFSDLEELKNFKLEGIDFGMGVASSLISVTNDMNPDTSGLYKDLVIKILHSSKISLESFKKWFEKVKPDIVYFRNGRVALYRPILRFCQQNKINFLIHDRGCNKNHYKISPDLRHNFDMVGDEVIEAWENEKDQQLKMSIAQDFYKTRANGIPQAWVAFLDKQEKGILPNDWDENKFNIVFFNSSFSEYAAIDNQSNESALFENQMDAIEFIAELLENKPNSDFYIRLHPNLVNQSEKEKRLWLDIDHPKIKVVRPDSKVDTYAMMQQADLVVTYLSTAGIEAAYYGKSVILLNNSYYKKLGSTYNPETKEELAELLFNKNLMPKPNLGALKYGYYMNTFGEKYKYFKPDSFTSGTFKGIRLRHLPLVYRYFRKLTKRLKLA